MNITTPPEQDAIFATEAAIRNKTLAEGETPHTAESIASLLLAKSATGYAATHMSAARAAMTPIADALIAGSEGLRTRVLGYAAAEIAKEQNA